MRQCQVWFGPITYPGDAAGIYFYHREKAARMQVVRLQACCSPLFHRRQCYLCLRSSCLLLPWTHKFSIGVLRPLSCGLIYPGVCAGGACYLLHDVMQGSLLKSNQRSHPSNNWKLECPPILVRDIVPRANELLTMNLSWIRLGWKSIKWGQLQNLQGLVSSALSQIILVQNQQSCSLWTWA